MARFSRLDVLNRIGSVGLLPVFHDGDPAVACSILEACAAAGVTVFEFTNRGDHAIDVFKAMAQHGARHLPDVILGAGTIVEAPTAALYVAHGAHFIVGPSFSAEVARFCNRRKIAYMPGCATLTEIGNAEEMGVEIVKVFPCECVGGVDFVKAVMGPSPWTRILPTGIRQVSPASLAEWFGTGIVAVGIGRELFKKDLLQKRDYAAISARAAELLAWVRAARSGVRS